MVKFADDSFFFEGGPKFMLEDHCFRVKCLNNYWLDCDNIPQDEL